MAIAANQVGQIEFVSANTTATSLVAPAAGTETTVLFVTVVNTTSVNDTITFYNDKDGTAVTTAQQISRPLPVKGPGDFTYPMRVFLSGNDGGTLFAKAAVGNGVTITAWGLERT